MPRHRRREEEEKNRKRLSTEMRALRGANSDGVIRTLNPIIAGWAAYYRIGASSRAFQALDHHVWRLTSKWARLSHPNKLRRWVVDRHFGAFNLARQDNWVFGSRETGFYLRKFAWTKIVRHQLVTGTASPEDPSLAEYWTQRRRRSNPPVGRAMHRLLQAQRGRCPACQGLLLHADREPQSPLEWERWLAATRKALRKHAMTAIWGPGTPDEHTALCLIHTHCYRRITSDGSTSTPGFPPPMACSTLRIEHDHHLFGVFPDATWRRLIDDPDVAAERVVLVGRRPAGREVPAADRGH
jgi:RNA-directed DNA polymerase